MVHVIKKLFFRSLKVHVVKFFYLNQFAQISSVKEAMASTVFFCFGNPIDILKKCYFDEKRLISFI